MTDASPNNAGADPTDKSSKRVYLDFYKLVEAPFAITPDPEFLFSSSCHQQVLDKISYAIDSRMGFILLTGEVGTGKTTLCRTLLDRLSGKAETVYVINPSVSGHELLAGILEDLGEDPPPDASKKALIDRLNQRLLSHDTNRPFVVIIDDSQTMTPETLEDLRLLSNLETDKHKLIQVVLSGQPELLAMLANEKLRQLKQRIAVHCRLEPLSTQETGRYISRRLFVAGNQGQVSFSHAATRLIHKTSGGIPRLINKICDFALTAGYVKDAPAIAPAHVKRALVELNDLDSRTTGRGGRILRYTGSATLMLVLMAVAFLAIRPGAWSPQASIHTGPMEIDQDGGSASTPVPHDPNAINPTPSPTTGESPSSDAAKFGSGERTTTVTTGTKNTALPSENGEPAPIRPQPAPYALQLASYHTAKNAERGVAHYRKNGVPAHWQIINDGRWYRIVSGKFENFRQATRYKTDHGLKTAMVINAPLTVKVLPRQPDIPDTDIRRLLSEIGHDSLMETDLLGDNTIYTGLFVSVENASITAERINRDGRLLAQVVTR